MIIVLKNDISKCIILSIYFCNALSLQFFEDETDARYNCLESPITRYTDEDKVHDRYKQFNCNLKDKLNGKKTY